MATSGDRAAMRLIAERLADERETLAPELAALVLGAEPVWGERGAEAAHIAEDIRMSVDGLVAALKTGGLPETAVRGVSRLAAWAAEEVIPWEAVASAASLCSRTLLDRALQWLGEEQWLDAPAASAATRTVVMQMTTLAGDFEQAMARAYRTTSPRVIGGGGHRQGEQIDDLLAGRSVGREHLPFELRSDHLAAIAWGDRRGRALRELAELLGSTVTIEQRRDQDWAWFHGSLALADDYKDTIRGFEPVAGAFLAFGGRGSGREGFAISHRQAAHAARVAAVSGSPVTLFSDVALEAFALADESLARRFVERQLGDLDDDRPRTIALRETLEAYFASGNRATAAAAALDVHERTVSYRIRASEERLGRYLTDCQDGLSLALRLRRLFEP